MSRKTVTPAQRYKLGPDVDLDQEAVLDSAGERITETRAQEMAEYAVQQVRRGRPSVTGRRGRTPTLTVRVDPGIRARLQRIAEAEHKVLAEIARDALTEYVRQHTHPSPPTPRRRMRVP